MTIRVLNTLVFCTLPVTGTSDFVEYKGVAEVAAEGGEIEVGDSELGIMIAIVSRQDFRIRMVGGENLGDADSTGALTIFQY